MGTGARDPVPPDAAGRGAVGIGGLPGALGAGLPPGGVGFGLAATGGAAGLFANELPGRDGAGELSVDSVGVFFHGVADPLAGAIPGKTEIGFAEAFAVTDCTGTFAAGLEAAAGGGRVRGGGGGAAATGFGGTSSR